MSSSSGSSRRFCICHCIRKSTPCLRCYHPSQAHAGLCTLPELSAGQDSGRWHWKSQCMETCMTAHRPHLQQGSFKPPRQFTSEKEENCVGPCLVPTSSTRPTRSGMDPLVSKSSSQRELAAPRCCQHPKALPTSHLSLGCMSLSPSICIGCCAWLGGHAAIEHGLCLQTGQAKLHTQGMQPDLSAAVRRRADGGTAPGRFAHKASSTDKGRPIPHLS